MRTVLDTARNEKGGVFGGRWRCQRGRWAKEEEFFVSFRQFSTIFFPHRCNWFSRKRRSLVFKKLHWGFEVIKKMNLRSNLGWMRNYISFRCKRWLKTQKRSSTSFSAEYDLWGLYSLWVYITVINWAQHTKKVNFKKRTKIRSGHRVL